MSRTPATPLRIAGFLTQKPGICLTVSAPGFLNGLTALANATTNCFPMILISGSSEREIVDLQQGDYEEMDQLAIAKPHAKAAFRVLHAEDIGVGMARAIRAALSGRPGGVYLDLPAQAVSADDGCARRGRASLIKVVDPAPRQIPAPDAVQRALELLKSAKRPLIILGKGAAYAQADADIRALVEKTGIPYLPMSMAKGLLPDTHAQSRIRRALVRAAGGRRRDADRRAPELAAVARQGQDLGRRERQGLGRPEVHPDRHLAAGSRQQRSRSTRPLVGDIGSCVSALLAGMGSDWPKPPAEWLGAIAERKNKNVAKMAETLAKNPSPMNFHSALQRGARHRQGESGRDPRQRGRQRARLHAQHRRHVQAAQAPGRRHLGRHGHRHGLFRRRGRGERRAGDRGRRRQRFRLLRHGSRDDLPLQPAGLRRDLEQQRRLPRRRGQSDRRARSVAAGVRQGRALRKDDGGLRRRRRAGHDAGGAAQRDGRGDPLAQADADQRGHRRKGGHAKAAASPASILPRRRSNERRTHRRK